MLPLPPAPALPLLLLLLCWSRERRGVRVASKVPCPQEVLEHSLRARRGAERRH